MVSIPLDTPVANAIMRLIDLMRGMNIKPGKNNVEGLILLMEDNGFKNIGNISEITEINLQYGDGVPRIQIRFNRNDGPTGTISVSIQDPKHYSAITVIES